MKKHEDHNYIEQLFFEQIKKISKGCNKDGN